MTNVARRFSPFPVQPGYLLDAPWGELRRPQRGPSFHTIRDCLRLGRCLSPLPRWFTSTSLTPISVFPPRHLDPTCVVPPLDSSDWDSTLCCLFGLLYFFCFSSRRFLAFFIKKKKKNFGNLCGSVDSAEILLSGSSRFAPDFDSNLCCAVTGTIVICLTPVYWVHCLRAAGLSPKKGPRPLVVILASSRTSLRPPSPPTSCLFLFFFPLYLYNISSIPLLFPFLSQPADVPLSAFFYIPILPPYHHKWRKQ